MKTVGRFGLLLIVSMFLAQGVGASSREELSRKGATGLPATEVNSNTFLGLEAGLATQTLTQNDTFVGYQAGSSNTTGTSNTFVGQQAGRGNVVGNFNTYVGVDAGANATGSSNVFIGSQAGMNEIGSHKLYISNNPSNPLIAGDFFNRILTINGNLTAIGPDSGLIRLANTTDNNTDKASRMVLLDFSSVTPNYLFGAFNNIDSHFVAFGGGAPVANAATQVDIFTAPVKGTLGGTARFTVLGDGKVGIGTQGPANPLQMGPQANNAFVSPAGVWTNGSSRAFKRDFLDVDPRAILDKVVTLPVQSWASNNEADSVRHIGPTAEDFYAAFGLGGDDKAIGTVDSDGIALAAIKGLHELVQDKDQALLAQQQLINALGERVARLEQALSRLERPEQP